MVILLYLQLPRSSSTLRAIVWSGKSTVTFSDMMTCVRRALWQQWVFHTQAVSQEFSKLSPSLQDTILYALAPAARLFLRSSADKRAKVELRACLRRY
jgi:hypothetical protein